MPESALPDFLRIGRRDRGDAVGELQPGLEEADAAVIFDAVDGEGLRRQAEGGEDFGRELALESEIMHGHHRAGARASAVMQISGGQARLPVVGVDDMRREARDEALAELGADFCERREAKGVVREIAAVRAGIGAAVAVDRGAARRARRDRGRPRRPASRRAWPPKGLRISRQSRPFSAPPAPGDSRGRACAARRARRAARRAGRRRRRRGRRS